jgi:hypothetical protein
MTCLLTGRKEGVDEVDLFVWERPLAGGTIPRTRHEVNFMSYALIRGQSIWNVVWEYVGKFPDQINYNKDYLSNPPTL